MKTKMLHVFAVIVVGLAFIAGPTFAADPSAGLGTGKKPNIVIIWGDDIGGFNISAYSVGRCKERRG